MKPLSTFAEAVAAVNNIANGLFTLQLWESRRKIALPMFGEFISEMREEPADERDRAFADIMEKIKEFLERHGD